MGLFSSRNSRSNARHSTSPYGTPTPASVADKPDSDGVVAESFAGKAEFLIDQAEMKLDSAHKLSLDIKAIANALGFTRVNLSDARERIKNRDLLMAKGVAESSYKMAQLVCEDVDKLLVRQKQLAELCRKTDGQLSAVRFAVADATVRGAALRMSLAAEDTSWPALRWLDQAAEIRATAAQELINNLEARLSRGELDDIEPDAERAAAWLDQADGYAKTHQALGEYLAAREKSPADQMNAAHILMCWAVSVFRDRFSREAVELLGVAELAYKTAIASNDAQAQEAAIKKTLAAVSVIEGCLFEALFARYKKTGSPQPPAVSGREEHSRAVQIRWLTDLFPRALSAKEKSRRESGYRADGLNCECCNF